MKYRALLVWAAIWMIGLIGLGLGLRPSAAAQANTGITDRISVAGGAQGNGPSGAPAISANGRFVAFSSEAANLVPNDSNKVADIFVHDRTTGQTSRVSVNSDGTQGNGRSFAPSISADGRYVAFASEANNLVPNDANGSCVICGIDVFVHDRETAKTTLVSLNSNGVQGNHFSDNPSISADGRFVAFSSLASNLVPNDTNYQADIFVRDRQENLTSRVSVGPNGSQAKDQSAHPAISADGRFVAFESWARNLVGDDANDCKDIFVHDRQTKETIRVSVNSNGREGNDESFAPSISADGRYVAFASEAGNLVPDDTNILMDVFIHDLQKKETIRVSVDSNGGQVYDWSGGPSISPDGRFVAFESWAERLVPGDVNHRGDVFVRDWQGGVTTLVSVKTGGGQGDERSHGAAISDGGRYVAFESAATNLVPNDTNRVADIFVHAGQEPIPPTLTPPPTATPPPTLVPTPDPNRIMLFVPVFMDN